MVEFVSTSAWKGWICRPFSLSPYFHFYWDPFGWFSHLIVIKLYDYTLYILLRNVLLCILNFYTCWYLFLEKFWLDQDFKYQKKKKEIQWTFRLISVVFFADRYWGGYIDLYLEPISIKYRQVPHANFGRLSGSWQYYCHKIHVYWRIGAYVAKIERSV